MLGANPLEPVESSMLTIYTRHAGDCDHRDDMNWRRCRCPKWIRGVLPNGPKPSYRGEDPQLGAS